MDITLVIVWFAIIAILFVIEGVTLNLVTLWFAIGAIPSLIMAFLGVPFPVQIISFVVLSVILLLSTKNVVRKLQQGRTIKTNSDALINEEGVALDSFSIGDNGYIKVRGMDWLAFSTTDDISSGDRVIVKVVTGSRVKIEKKK